MELGGNISLSGFSERDFTEMIVVKKIVGQYARKFTDHVPDFSRLSITLKEVHGHAKHEIVTKIQAGGREYDSEVTDVNIFVALDKTLKHCWEQVQKDLEKSKE